jgi:hypothetical protein
MTLVATLAAIAASLLSAAALYAASRHCRWPSWRQRGTLGNAIGAVLAVVALALWIAQLGIGAGLCAMLGTWMGGLMLLPYLAWRTAPDDNGGSR